MLRNGEASAEAKKGETQQAGWGKGVTGEKAAYTKAQRDTPQREFGKQKVGQCHWSSDRIMGVGGVWGL